MQQEQQQQQQQQPSQLTLTDIYKMRSVIDVASTRGTFQGKEMSLIGDLYNKLDIIVQAVEKKTETSEGNETGEAIVDETGDGKTVVDENTNESEAVDEESAVAEN